MSQCNKCSDKKCTPSGCGAPACDKSESTSLTCAPAVCNFDPCKETTLRTTCNLETCATLEERAKKLAMNQNQNNDGSGLNDINTDDDGAEGGEIADGADGAGANDKGPCDCRCIHESATCTEVCTKCGKCKGVVIPNDIYGNSDK